MTRMNCRVLQLADRKYFRTAYVNEALNGGWIEMTIPDKPTSRNQKYRLTEKGLKAKQEWKINKYSSYKDSGIEWIEKYQAIGR